MTAPQQRVTVPGSIGENRKRIRILEAYPHLISLRPPQLMGACQPALVRGISGVQVRSRAGIAFRADEERPLVTGDELRVDYFQDTDEFDQLSFRAHLATGLVLTDYDPRQPWESKPWSGSASSGGTSLSPLFADWNGAFYCFVGICDSPGATLHFQSGTGTINSDETAGFDTAGGHIGYLFHNATAADASNVTVTASAGTVAPTGFVRMDRGSFTGTVVTTTLGSVDQPNSREAMINLSADVPEGDCVLVMVGSADNNVDNIGDAAARPYVTDYTPFEFQTGVVQKTPHYFQNERWFPILAPSERLGTGDQL